MDYFDRVKEIISISDSWTTFYIKRFCTSKDCKVYFATRWYGAYDRPDWYYHFVVTPKEAEDIIKKFPNVRYWGNKDETWITSSHL